MSYRSNNKTITFIFLIMFLGVGFAFIFTDLKIEGTTKIKRNTWNVHFDKDSLTTSALANINLPIITDEPNNLNIKYTTRLDEPGDAYEFSIDIVNDGTIDAMIDEFSMTPEIDEVPEYLIREVTWENNQVPKKYDELKKGERLTLNISLKYRDDVEPNQLPQEDIEEMIIQVRIRYVQANNNSKEVITYKDEKQEVLIAFQALEDGISMIQTTEGALNEYHDMAQRMSELIVHAANDTNSSVDLQVINNEYNQLVDEINNVSEST